LKEETAQDALLYFDESDDSWYGGVSGGTMTKLGTSTISNVTDYKLL
jgi:hypothetical protein